MKNRIINKITAIGLISLLLPITSLADTATTSVNLAISAPGGTDLSVTAPGPVTITGKNVSISDQYSSGTLSDSTITDVRGTLVGWNITAQMTNLSTTTVPQNAVGTAFPSDITLTGTSTCMKSTTSNGAAPHTLTIDSNYLGAGLTPTWTIRLSNEVSSSGEGNSVDFGDGVTATLSSPATSSVVRIPISCSFYSQASSTPTAVASVSGSTYGISQSVAALFTGSATTSDAMTIQTADEGTGNGSFTYDLLLGITVLKNSAAGTHSGTLTLTIS